MGASIFCRYDPVMHPLLEPPRGKGRQAVAVSGRTGEHDAAATLPRHSNFSLIRIFIFGVATCLDLFAIPQLAFTQRCR